MRRRLPATVCPPLPSVLRFEDAGVTHRHHQWLTGFPRVVAIARRNHGILVGVPDAVGNAGGALVPRCRAERNQPRIRDYCLDVAPELWSTEHQRDAFF